MRTTHTFATLEVSAAAFDEVAQKLLRAAEYDHAFVGDCIDMRGIALERETPATSEQPKWCPGCSRYVKNECHHFHCPVKP